MSREPSSRSTAHAGRLEQEPVECGLDRPYSLRLRAVAILPARRPPITHRWPLVSLFVGEGEGEADLGPPPRGCRAAASIEDISGFETACSTTM
jgi:hypothetical protein